MDLAEDYGVIVAHTLIDASSWSDGVLMLGPGVDCFGGSCGAGSAERGVRDLAGSSGRQCRRVAPFSGRGWSTVAQEPSPSV